MGGRLRRLFQLISMARNLYSTIQNEIAALKTERQAVVLAHNYQTLDVQKVADHVGDSLHLARVVSRLEAKVVVFAGVHFMAETANILSPRKIVLIPDLEAGCSLAGTIRAVDVRRWRERFPDGIVVSYVNCSAAVKAESDYCCTSSNSCSVVASLPKDKEVFFVPDFFLGFYTQRVTGRKLHLWNGYCHVHERINSAAVEEAKARYPAAELLMHPECGCMTQSMHVADRILSTGGMVDYVSKSQRGEFLIATEKGLTDQLSEAHPRKRFHTVGDDPTCEYMKLNNLEKIVESLEKLQYPVVVPEETARRARRAIERMISIS